MTAIDTVSSYQTDFERLEQQVGEPPWLHALRADAFARFTALGFPPTRQEAWRFTNVTPIAERAFERPDVAHPLVAADIAAHSFAESGADELVVVNGRLAPALSSV